MLRATSDKASDPAGWVSASYSHHPVEDIESKRTTEFLVGYIKDAIVRGFPIQATRNLIFACIDQAVKDANLEGWECEGSKESMEAICEVLHYLKNTPSTRVFCYALLMILGRSEKSEVEVAKHLRVTKACVSKIKRAVQAHYQIPSLIGRNEVACRKFAAIRIDSALCQKPKVKDWPAGPAFLQGLRTPQPA